MFFWLQRLFHFFVVVPVLPFINGRLKNGCKFRSLVLREVLPGAGSAGSGLLVGVRRRGDVMTVAPQLLRSLLRVGALAEMFGIHSL